MKIIITAILILFCLSCKKEKTDKTSKLLSVLAIANSTKGKSYTVTTLAGSGSQGSTNGAGIEASFLFPYAVAVDGNGVVYVADRHNNKIRKVTSAGVVTTLAGSGVKGSADGISTAASFNLPHGIAIDNTNGNVYVADTNSHKIRLITNSGVVSTVAGSGTEGSADGTGIAATFHWPMGVAVDTNGTIFVADNARSIIRKIASNGIVTTIAGTGSGAFKDGVGTAASFYNPISIAIDSNGILYVGDNGNSKIRKITSSYVVSTITKSSNSNDGTGVDYFMATGIAVDNTGTIFIAEALGNRIRKITTEGIVTTIAGSGVEGSTDGIGTTASFNFPSGIAINADGVIYVADSYNHKIRKITLQ